MQITQLPFMDVLSVVQLGMHYDSHSECSLFAENPVIRVSISYSNRLYPTYPTALSNVSSSFLSVCLSFPSWSSKGHHAPFSWQINSQPCLPWWSWWSSVLILLIAWCIKVHLQDLWSLLSGSWLNLRMCGERHDHGMLLPHSSTSHM